MRRSDKFKQEWQTMGAKIIPTPEFKQDWELALNLMAQNDPNTAVLVLRDHQELADAGLTQTAWVVNRTGNRAECEAFLDEVVELINLD